MNTWPPLPYPTRLRLAAASRIDRAGTWLCGHRCTQVAEVMWRVCRLMRDGVAP